MINDVFIEDDLLGRHDLSLGRTTPAPQTATGTANHYCSSIGLRHSASKVHRTKYPEDYDLHEKCIKFDACANV